MWRHAVNKSVRLHIPHYLPNAWTMLEPIFMKLNTYIMYSFLKIEIFLTLVSSHLRTWSDTICNFRTSLSEFLDPVC
jgi:hypothetical protein